MVFPLKYWKSLVISLVYCSEPKHNVSKYSKMDKDDDKSKSSSRKESETPAKCWLYPQTRVRIISKHFKKGKYYNKKVRLLLSQMISCLQCTLSFQKKHAVFSTIESRTAYRSVAAWFTRFFPLLASTGCHFTLRSMASFACVVFGHIESLCPPCEQFPSESLRERKHVACGHVNNSSPCRLNTLTDSTVHWQRGIEISLSLNWTERK